MLTAWTKRFKTEEEKQQYIQSVQRAKWVLDDIIDMVDSNLASQEAQEISPKSYDSPNWQFRQAHANGYKQALNDFKNLLTIDK